MVNDVVTEVMEAEKQAEEIVQSAVLRAREISEQATTESASYIANAEANLSLTYKAKMVEAEKHASDLYAATVKEGKAEAEKIKEKLSVKVDKLSKNVVEKVLRGDC